MHTSKEFKFLVSYYFSFVIFYCRSSLNCLHVISERLVATGDDEGCVKVIKL